MLYTVLSIVLVVFLQLLKNKMPKSSITMDYFKGDLSILDEPEIPTY